jgi:hypothetical protein
MFDRSQISIWSILKQFIGKELTKIAMPAALCEPLSFLQRFSENVFHSQLLDKAATATDPCKRMEYVAAFAVTNITGNLDRLSKPFNPLLGETFELCREDLGFKILLEQVSHHVCHFFKIKLFFFHQSTLISMYHFFKPPVSAFQNESTNNNNWKFYGTVNPKVKFWGKSMEVKPLGLLTVELGK